MIAWDARPPQAAARRLVRLALAGWADLAPPPTRRGRIPRDARPVPTGSDLDPPPSSLSPRALKPSSAEDRLRTLQEQAIATKDQKVARAYHFGSQGTGDVFSNHKSHSNRMVPVYVFGRKADLGSVTGKNSRYRTAEGVRPLYGVVPENTVNPEAEYGDQSDLFKVQKDAVGRGAKYR